MKTKLIEFDNGEIKARIVVSEANTEQDYTRSILRNETIVEGEKVPARMLARLVYPDAVAAAQSIEITGIEGIPTFEQWLSLPGRLTRQWADAAYDLNPFFVPEETDEKKAAS